MVSYANPILDISGTEDDVFTVTAGTSLPVYSHVPQRPRVGISRSAGYAGRGTKRKRTTSRSFSELTGDVLTGVGRFGSRTLSTGGMPPQQLLPELADDDEDDRDSESRDEDTEERCSEHTISNAETIIHLVKGNIGMGVLTLPMAVRNAGLMGGCVGIAAIATICVFCMHLLVKSAHKACAKRDNRKFMDYADTAEAAFLDAGGRWAGWASFVRKFLNTFLCMNQIGSNAVYTLFMAQNIEPILQHYGGSFFEGLNYRFYILMLLVPMLLLCSIKNLRYLSPFSVVANAMQLVGIGIIFYYMFKTELPNSHSVPWFDDGGRLPLFFGTAIFAIEGISVVLPIENQMRYPQDMSGWNGVLNLSMSIITCLYIAMGFFGYLKFGEAIESSITLNLPAEEVGAQVVLLLFSLAIFFSYALQFYVVMEILGPNVIRPLVPNRFFAITEFLVRIVLNLVTFALAATIPWLDLFVSLIGAVKMSTLSLMAPAIIDTASNWADIASGRRLHVVIRNILIFIFGFCGCVIGTYVSMKDIIGNFRKGEPHD